MDKVQALQIWSRCYKDSEYAYDFAAQKMKRDDFEDEKSPYAWTINTILPLKNGGSILPFNLIPCSTITSHIRDDKNSFRIGHGIFEVRKGKKYNTFSLYDVTDRNHPLNLDPTFENQGEEYNKKRWDYLYKNIQESEKQFVLPSIYEIANKIIDENSPSTINVRRRVEEVKEEVVSTSETEPEEVEEETVVEEESDKTPIESSDGVILEEVKIDETIEDVASDDEVNTPIVDEVEEVEEEKDEISVDEEDTSSKDEAIEELNSQIKGRDDEISSLKEQVESKDERIEKLASDIKSLNDQIYSLQRENLTSFTSVQENSKVISLLKQQLNDKIVLEEKLQEEIALKEKDLESYKCIKKDLENRLNEIEETRKKENESLSLSQEKIEEDIIKYSQEIQSLNKQIDEKNCQLEEKEKVLDSNSIEISSLKDRIVALTSEIESLNENISEKEAEIASLNADIRSRESMADDKERDNDANISLLNEKIEAKEIDIVSLKNQIEGLIKEKDLKEEESSKRLEDLNIDIETLKKERDELALYLKEKEDKIDELILSLSKKEEEISSINEREDENTKIAEELNCKIASLTKERDDLQKEIEQMDAQEDLESGQVESLQYENDSLSRKIVDLKDQIASLDQQLELSNMEKDSLSRNRDELEKEIKGLENTSLALKAEKESILADKQSIFDRLVEKEAQYKNLNDNHALLNSSYLNLQQEKEEELNEKKEQIDELNEYIDTLSKEKDILKYGVDPSKLDEIKEYLRDDIIDDESIKEMLKEHPEYRSTENHKVEEISDEALKDSESEDVSYIEKERVRKGKALSYWSDIYGDDVYQSVDFAGREISLKDYNLDECETSWDYILLDRTDRDYSGNVLIANKYSLRDFKYDQPFTSDNKTFKLEKKDGKYQVVSDEYITDPYNLASNLKLVAEKASEKKPLIYIFVKPVQIQREDFNTQAMMEFFSLIDKTAKICCPRSFLEVKTVLGKNPYAFITFEYVDQLTYKEVIDYAVLLNSYRNEFRKNPDKINAIIVLNQIKVTSSMKHLSFEQLFQYSKDLELKALQFDFNTASIVDSSITRSLHIGPSIVDDLPINHANLKDSNIGKGSNFSEVYKFNKQFYLYNFATKIRTKLEEER